MKNQTDLSRCTHIIVCLFTGLVLGHIICSLAHAEDYATAAVGIADSGKNSHAETKFVNVGHRADLPFGLTYQVEGGGWVDIAGGGRKSSGYGATQVGVQTDGPVVARVMTGPAIITSPDVYLGGNFQFTEDFYIGIKGPNQNTVGIMYKHFSSAGIEQPNVGRDLAGVQVGIPF